MGFSKYWLNAVKQPKYRTWSGFAFEAVCMKHIGNIVKALDIESVASDIGSWQHQSQKKSSKPGAQIDLVIDRVDNCINVCEIKFSDKEYIITKEYAKKLVQKIDIFEEVAKPGKQVFLSMITTHGVKKNLYSEDLVDSQVMLKDLWD